MFRDSELREESPNRVELFRDLFVQPYDYANKKSRLTSALQTQNLAAYHRQAWGKAI
jgi:hypothetical protein